MIKKEKKKKEEALQSNYDKYHVWKRYNDFIRELYLETPIQKTTKKELFFQYLTKIFIIFFASLFTTSSFYFLIDPNGLYNSGLNGLLQLIAKLAEIKLAVNYHDIYYILCFLLNLFFVLILKIFFKAKLEIISTSLFYVIFQAFWTKFFTWINLREFLFSNFNPSNWKKLTSESQLSFTFPYYILIAVIASLIHTWGYSLIFRAKATPGGLDIFVSHFSTKSTKENKGSAIGKINKIFGIFIVFVVTAINFFWLEENQGMKMKSLEKEVERWMNSQIWEEAKEKEELTSIIDNWKEKQKEKKKWEKDNDYEKWQKHKSLTETLRKISNYSNIENFPEEIDFYKLNRAGKIEWLKEELNREGIDFTRKYELKKRLNFLLEQEDKNPVIRYLEYITNNERFWSTMIYIFLSSYLVGQIFPKEKLIMIELLCEDKEDCYKGLKIMKNFYPYYYHIQKEKEKEEKIYVARCYMSKWNFYLMLPYLEQLGKIYINETKSGFDD